MAISINSALPLMQRRSFISSTAYILAGSGLSACASSSAVQKPKRPFVLVHGAWHGAWCWERVAPLLTNAGYAVVARDLPGHGLSARLPRSFSEFPRTAAFSDETSPVAGITLADYAEQIVETVEALLARGSAPPILAAHSMGGLAIHAAAEALGPAKVHRLIYIAAFMPANNASMATYTAGSTQADSKLQPLFRANPSRIGALRIDPRSQDPAYLAALSDAFYGDVDPNLAAASRHLLTPDIPAKPLAAPLRISPGLWGAIPRSYIQTSMDATVRPATQALMIAQADAFSPRNQTRIVQLQSSHSPFLSQPKVLADAMLAHASIG